MIHEEGCRCAMCRWSAAGMSPEQVRAKYQEWETEQMNKHGWIVHYLEDDPESPTGVNYHTHGLTDTFNHLDLQLVVSLPEKTAHGILSGTVDLIKEGHKFAAGDTAEKIVKGYNVKFVTATEGGRVFLRIILPDIDGNLDYDQITGSMKEQYNDLEETNGSGVLRRD